MPQKFVLLRLNLELVLTENYEAAKLIVDTLSQVIRILKLVIVASNKQKIYYN